MRLMRQVYVYLAWLTGLEVMLWGLSAALAQMLIAQPAWQRAESLAENLAAVLVGAPVMALHWVWARRLAARPEERQAWVRALALFLAWGIALWVTFRAALSLLYALLARDLGFWREDLAQGVVFALAALVLWQVLRGENSLSHRQMTRWHAWFWWFFGWALWLLGVEQAAWLLGGEGVSDWDALVRLLGGVALVLGLVLWWRRVGRGASRFAAVEAALLGLAFLTALAGVAWWWGWGLERWVRLASTGAPRPQTTLWPMLAGLLAWGGWAWWEHRRWRAFEAALPAPQGRLWRARVEGLVALGGAVVLALGLANLLEAAFAPALGGEAVYPLARGVAGVLTGLPLWALAWTRLNYPAERHPTLSALGRKGYLYLALFLALVAEMGWVGELIYWLLQGVLADSWRPAAEWGLQIAQAALWALLGGWHVARLRADARLEATQMGPSRQMPKVLLLSDGTEPLLARLHERMRALFPLLEVTWHEMSQGLPEHSADYRVVVLPGAALARLDPTWRLWLERFHGLCWVLPHGGRWAWLGAPDEDALLAEALERITALLEGERPVERLTWWVVALALPLLVIWTAFWGSVLTLTGGILD